jgi:hypothetical protein
LPFMVITYNLLCVFVPANVRYSRELEDPAY